MGLDASGLSSKIVGDSPHGHGHTVVSRQQPRNAVHRVCSPRDWFQPCLIGSVGSRVAQPLKWMEGTFIFTTRTEVTVVLFWPVK